MPSSKEIRFIGIDGGGTKTACMIGDGLGNVLAVCYGASSSIKSNSREAVQEVLLSLIQQVLELSDSSVTQLKGVFLGLAGSDRPEDKVQILSLFEGKLPASVVITVHNDAITALSAGTWGEAGIVLISGTGSIAYGFVPEASVHVRVGGWGYLLGDEVALKIAEKAVGDLAQIAITAQKKLQQLHSGQHLSDLPLLLSGGLFSDRWFQILFESQDLIQTSRLKVSKLEVSPVTGCYVLALKQAGIAITDSMKIKIRVWETRRKLQVE
ncbi:BadF/BadG/BcrA/BcrD ATPase family protein [Paenibacillus sp. 1_12]|uniref:N-acetylglucosamine kinase n=1 Tax=Paenibacillus sp. 1_12 TaxID=1566278 RepID=UPI0008DFB06C|nr:BadF/BadG/BcrA/BcrD ATPase family protein [Paenibacillus sp. 1_12]SFL37011.1 BadF/BadG/BcrA/BcrD ATPase family protein [Paenibacillus sp. 1_12]